MKTMSQETRRVTQNAWQILIVESQMLGEIIASHRWRTATDPRSETIQINRRTLLVNEEWWAGRKAKGRVFFLAHEATHIVQRAWDRGRVTNLHQAEPHRLNMALDYAVNGILENDRNISKYITPEIKKAGCFPKDIGQENGQEYTVYFDIIGPQPEDQTSEDGEPEEPNEDDEHGQDGTSAEGEGEEGTEGGSNNEGDDKQQTEDIEERIRNCGIGDSLNQGIRAGIVPKEEAHAIDRWQDILRDFLWRKTREEKSYNRPSRRWDGDGAILPGRASRNFPKTALIIDFSGSMEDYITTCAESIVNLIATVSSDEVYVIGCSNRIDYEWIIRRNQRCPTTQEILNEFTGGGTHMMPGIKLARTWGAEIILCVSDMFTREDDFRQDDVVWITDHTNTYADEMRRVTGYPKNKVFKVLNVES